MKLGGREATGAEATRRPYALGLPARLAILTALLAVGLVLSGSNIAQSWSDREHIEDDRRGATSLAQTLASYLVTIAPDGDLDSLIHGFTSWERTDISGADAWVYVVLGDSLVPINPPQDSAPVPDQLARTALADQVTQVRYERSPESAWRIAVPLGERAPYGVLSVTVPTQRLEALPGQRRRTYLLALASALLVALSVAGLTARWVGRPLRGLGRAIAEAQDGAGPAVAPEIGPREFRAVARRYNDMQRALAARERESAARAALLALEERARGYDRLAVSAETSAELAHEIGTPLSTMRGHIQLLRDDLAHSGEAAPVDRINSLLAQLDRVTAIVRAGLERGTWPAPVLETADLVAIATRLLRFLEPSLDAAGVRAELRPGTGAALARCDPALVEQILLNLIKNAIEALPPGGRVELLSGVENGTAFLEVADDGPGLSPEARAYLFNPFATTKGKAGTGLGLVVSRRLARVLGGELTYLSGRRGTQWRLTLPAAARAGTPAVPPPRSS